MATPESVLAVQIRLAEAAILERVHEIVEYLRERNRLDDVEDAIRAGRFDDAIREVDRAGAMLAETTALAYVSAGQATATLIEGLAGAGARVTFEITNPRAVEYLRANRFETIRGLTQSQLGATRAALIHGQEVGINPRQTARLFRDSIGLTDYQVQVVENYRRALLSGDAADALSRELRDRRNDPRIRRIGDDPLTRAQVDERTEAYRQRWIDFRAETIARTEALRAVHAGTDEAWAQAVEDGDVDPADIVCEWHVAGGVNRRGKRRTRDSHWQMRDQTRPYGVAFLSGHGNPLRYPCDPAAPASETVRCRCNKVTRLIVRAA